MTRHDLPRGPVEPIPVAALQPQSRPMATVQIASGILAQGELVEMVGRMGTVADGLRRHTGRLVSHG